MLVVGPVDRMMAFIQGDLFIKGTLLQKTLRLANVAFLLLGGSRIFTMFLLLRNHILCHGISCLVKAITGIPKRQSAALGQNFEWTECYRRHMSPRLDFMHG